MAIKKVRMFTVKVNNNGKEIVSKVPEDMLESTKALYESLGVDFEVFEPAEKNTLATKEKAISLGITDSDKQEYFVALVKDWVGLKEEVQKFLEDNKIDVACGVYIGNLEDKKKKKNGTKVEEKVDSADEHPVL